jgi:SAM-dependent methyltransferase
MVGNSLKETCAMLVCPQTKLSLSLYRIDAAEARIGGGLQARPDCTNSKGVVCPPVGRSEWVLLRSDEACAYPVVDGVPILLAPEMLLAGRAVHAVDLCLPQYAEAYDEMGFYNEEARRESLDIERSEGFQIVHQCAQAAATPHAAFPAPSRVWIDAVYDSLAQIDAYQRLTPLPGRRLMQLGGKGIHAVKLLLAGADQAWSVTPMLGEALCGRALGEKVGVGDRLHPVVAVAEELPFSDGVFDGIYSGGCLHHMQTPIALPEISRVLRTGGGFVAVDPWRAPLYALGTRLLGKREAGAYCRPLTPERVSPLATSFGASEVIHHGALTRYLFLALDKLGLKSGLTLVLRATRLDDAVSALIPALRSSGSSVVVHGIK